MYSHISNNYDCPFCAIVNNKKNDELITRKSDIFYENGKITAFISTHSWFKNK
jgi:histidine triad (HIT) family protein